MQKYKKSKKYKKNKFEHFKNNTIFADCCKLMQDIVNQ